VLPEVVVRGRRNPLHFGLASRLKRARCSVGLSYESLAKAAGVQHANTVFQIERKPDHVPRCDTVEKVAYALGLSPAFLAYGIESDASQPVDGLRCEGVAARLRETRTARGLTMRALARAAGLTDTAVRSTETGASMPGIATVESLAVALGVSPGWLAYGIGPTELPGRRRAAESPAPRPG
jgi:transcriptional regulator with XRE-family HTH domain